MTPEIEALNRQISALQLKRDGLIQAHMAASAIAPIGGLINWTRGAAEGRKYLGKVTGYRFNPHNIAYIVRVIHKGGVEGKATTVYSWDKPQPYVKAEGVAQPP